MREKTFARAFGRALRAAREEAGLTQREVAERAGIADKHLSRLELGGSSVSLYTAHKLADTLGVKVDDLIGGASRSPEFAAIAELLKGRPDAEVERAVRVLRAHFS